MPEAIATLRPQRRKASNVNVHLFSMVNAGTGVPVSTKTKHKRPRAGEKRARFARKMPESGKLPIEGARFRSYTGEVQTIAVRSQRTTSTKR